MKTKTPSTVLIFAEYDKLAERCKTLESAFMEQVKINAGLRKKIADLERRDTSNILKNVNV